MKKKKIVFINNNFQKSDGTVTALIGLCNCLDYDKFDVTIVPLYNCDMSIAKQLNSSVHIKKVFGFYFKGLNRLVRLIPPDFLYKKFIGNSYDVEIAFQSDVPTKIVGYERHNNKVQICWMHTYDLFPKQYKNVDKIVCVSECNVYKCKKELSYEKDVVCCYNLIDDKKIVKMGQESAFIPGGKGPLLVTVGRLVPHKGFARLVKILYELKLEKIFCRLIIIGGGKEEKHLREIINKYKMFDCVYLLGKQDNPHKYTSKADLFVCPSFSEGYSTACTEAAILNIPILTTKVAGSEELIRDCECGAVCGLDDESLKKALKSILLNKDIINEWKCILNKTKRKFSLKVREKDSINLFDEIYNLSEKRAKYEK